MRSATELAALSEDEDSNVLDRVFAALADPVRRSILRRLEEVLQL